MPVKPTVTAEEIEKIAGLARLSLTPDQREEYTDQINTILDHMRTLETADTEGVEPLSHVLDLSDVTRPDALSRMYRWIHEQGTRPSTTGPGPVPPAFSMV